MKKLFVVITSLLFVVSCASTSVEESKVAKNESVKEQAKEKKSGKSRKDCGNNTVGSRLKRC